MLAESLDAEELDAYDKYLLAGGDKKKWKWSSPDKAGTEPFDKASDQVANSLIKFGEEVLRLDMSKTRKGKARDFATITGKQIALMNPDGVLFDSSGVITKRSSLEPGTIIIRIDYDGNDLN